MTDQEIFDKVYVALTTQKVASTVWMYGLKTCAYRGDNGTKCAAGHLIDDSSYRASLEGLRCGSNVVQIALLKSGVPESSLELVHQLQDCHDTYLDQVDTEKALLDFTDKMKHIAKANDLTFNF